MFQINRTLKANAEGGDGHGAPGYEHPQDKGSQNGDQTQGHQEAPLQLSAEQEREAVEKAVSEFQSEAQSQQHGIKASIASTPGLRVVLSDVNGNVIRQFEGREFLRLRSSGVRDSRGRGKLLDQKY